MMPAIILAAGNSSRMGYPKALLTIGHKTFLQHIVEHLNSVGVAEIVIVLGSDASKIEKSLLWYDGITVFNSHWEDGQLTSINAGLQAVRTTNIPGLLVWPVDRPLVRASTISAMLDAFFSAPGRIIVPRFNGKRGHPVLIGRSFLGELPELSHSLGARELLWRHPLETVDFDTEDEGVVLNIDTPEVYDEVIGKPLRARTSSRKGDEK